MKYFVGLISKINMHGSKAVSQMCWKWPILAEPGSLPKRMSLMWGSVKPTVTHSLCCFMDLSTIQKKVFAGKLFPESLPFSQLPAFCLSETCVWPLTLMGWYFASGTALLLKYYFILMSKYCMCFCCKFSVNGAFPRNNPTIGRVIVPCFSKGQK